jgi:hypothetical protein
LPAPAGGRGTRALTKGVEHLGAHGLHGGRQREQHGGRRRESSRNEQRAGLQVEVIPAGHEALNALGNGGARGGDAGHRERHGRQRRNTGEQAALDQELPQDAPAAGPERHAHGQLLLALGAAREQQVRDVRAAEQQQQERRRLPHRHEVRGAWIAHAAVEREHRHGPVGVRLRIRLPLGLDQRLHLGVGALQRDAVGQPAHHDQPPAIAAVHHVLVEDERHPEPGAHRDAEARRRHADHDRGCVVDQDRPAHDVGIRRVAHAPQHVAEDDDARSAGHGLGGEEVASERERHPQRGQEVPRDEAGRHGLRIAVGGERDLAVGLGRGEPFEGGRLRLPVEKVGGGHGGRAPELVAVRGRDDHGAVHARPSGAGATRSHRRA